VEKFLDKCDPDGKYVGSSDYEGQADLRDDIEYEAKVMRERVIAYHQLKAFALFLEDKPAQSAAYREYLVSVFLWCLHVFYCNDNNLTPSFCRCSTVARLLPTGRLGSHWYLRRRGDLSQLRQGILM